jgi:probable rRNA maturation factor
MKTYIKNQQRLIPISAKSAKALACEVVAFEGYHYDEVTIHFVSTKRICQLHDQFFQDPTTTDCISFPMEEDLDEEYRLMGDVFVCPETALNYSTSWETDLYEEISLYVVHGLLHLMGYDDMNSKDKTIMRRAEKRHLSHLKTRHLTLQKN